jgi:hypothetical protein
MACRISGAPTGGYEEFCPFSLLKVNRRFGGTCRLHRQDWRIIPTRNQRENLPPTLTPVSCLAYYSILKTESTCSSETSVDSQRTTRRYVPEDKSSSTAVALNVLGWCVSWRITGARLAWLSTEILCKHGDGAKLWRKIWDSQVGVYEDFFLQACDTVYSDKYVPAFRRNLLLLSSSWK